MKHSICALFVLTNFLLVHLHSTTAVDCRQYVFHPKCRGITAKRSGDVRSDPRKPVILDLVPEDVMDGIEILIRPMKSPIGQQQRLIKMENDLKLKQRRATVDRLLDTSNFPELETND